jgi:hypothetical protein
VDVDLSLWSQTWKAVGRHSVAPFGLRLLIGSRVASRRCPILRPSLVSIRVSARPYQPSASAGGPRVEGPAITSVKWVYELRQLFRLIVYARITGQLPAQRSQMWQKSH